MFDLDLTGVEDLLGHQLERLETAGLTERSADPFVVETAASPDDPGQDSTPAEVDRSERSSSIVLGPCGAVQESGIQRDPDASVAVLVADDDATVEQLRAIEIFLGSSIFVGDFRLLNADGLEPARFVLQFQPGMDEEVMLALGEELLILPGITEVSFPAEC